MKVERKEGNEKENMNRNRAKKILLACVGILLIGIGVAWNAGAGLGNDPVAIFYDGIRNALNLEAQQLGMASNIVNFSLTVVLFIIGRRYVNWGTIIYILPYGLSVSIGTELYTLIFAQPSMVGRVLASILGCAIIYTGIAIYIAVDIGMDPMTGIAMVIKDKMHWDFKRAKWLFDGTMTLLGFLLGGKLGVITVITVLSAGPSIQGIAKCLTRALGSEVRE